MELKCDGSDVIFGNVSTWNPCSSGSAMVCGKTDISADSGLGSVVRMMLSIVSALGIGLW